MNKKLLGVLGVAALLLAGNFAWQETKTVDAASINSNTELYLEINDKWGESTARFAAYFYNSSLNKFVDMERIEHGKNGNYSGSIYKVSAPSGTWTNVIFCRMNGSTTANNWDNKWNQTGDLVYDGTKNLYKMNAGDWSNGSWSTKTESTFNLVGTMNGWDLSTTSLEKVSEGTYSTTLSLEAESYTFKIAKNGAWDISYGNKGKIEDKTDTGWTMNNDNDCTLIASGGDYTFTYNAPSNKLTVTHKSYADMLSELVSDYVVDGTYTKKTTINLDQNSEDLQVEFASLFHANQVPALTRTTYYNGDSLWMTNDEGTVNSGYGTSGEDMTHFKVVEGAAVVDYTVKGVGGMEGFYVTPRDFTVDGYFDGWTYNSDNKEYTLAVSNSDKIVSDFVNVVAPLLLDTVLTSNYITVTSLVAKETTDGLVLQIIAAGDEGKLGGSTVLAEATITKDCAQTWTF